MIHFTNARECGFLPEFFSENDPRPAVEQLDENYAHGGGVHPSPKFGLKDWDHPRHAYLTYPGDPRMKERARGKLRNETIILFEADFVAIVQPDGSFIVTRCD